MRQSETNDEQLRQEFQKNLPMVDAEQGWDRLQARLVNELSPGVARPLVRRRRAMLAAVAAGASARSTGPRRPTQAPGASSSPSTRSGLVGGGISTSSSRVKPKRE